MTNLPVNLDTLQHAKQKVVDLSIEFGPMVFKALLILTVGFFVARWVGGLFERWIARVNLEPPVRLLMLRIVQIRWTRTWAEKGGRARVAAAAAAPQDFGRAELRTSSK